MPLPDDQHLITLSEDLLTGLKTVFGKHPGFRPAHAKGRLLTGTFTPTPEAKELTTAPHFNQPSTPITGRFSNSTGIPVLPDTDPNGDPRGFAVRFHLGDRVHTDFITHSTPFFPVTTGEDFLAFLNAIIASPPGTPSPTPLEQFVGSHPSAIAFVTAPKPTPASLATEPYFAVNALKFISVDGKETYFRYRVVPEAGIQTLDADSLKDKSPNFLYDELPVRLEQGPIKFKLLAQLAEDGDVVDDATVHWPEERRLVELGTISLDQVVPEQDDQAKQKYMIFDPIPRVQGIEPSADPLLELRAALYLISGRERRAA